MTARDSRDRFVRRLLHILVHAYPAAFRDQYGRDIEETELDRYREARARGAGAAMLVLVNAFLDAALNGVPEHLASPMPRPVMFYWVDVRYAMRLLRRSPLFTLLTIVVLSGGLGLSIFTFSFLHTAMMRPLPLDEGDRIVRVQQATGSGLDVADLALMRPDITTLREVGAYTTHELIVGSDDGRRALRATAAEWNIFQFTRTPPELGRGFYPEDAISGAEPVIVLGYRTWQFAFGGDSSIVDRRIIVNGAPARVIGVMPDGYGFPAAASAWVPLDAATLAAQPPGVTELHVYARLAPGVDARTARVELTTLHARVRQSRPQPAESAVDVPLPTGILVRSFPMAQFDDDGPLVFAILNVLSALVLLLACINVTNLLLARANERARETAVRLALGASRSRLVVQSLWESVLLCIAGGAVATALAAWGLGVVNAWAHTHLEGNLTFWWVWAPDRTTLLAAGAFITVALAVLGGVVSVRASNISFVEVLQDGGARAGGRREGRVARALVATQIATVSVLMLFGVLSGILAHRVANAQVGFDTRNLLSSRIVLPDDRHAAPRAAGQVFATLHDRLTAEPSLDGVVLRARLAHVADRESEFTVDAATLATPTMPPRAYVQGVFGDLHLVGAALREGRTLDARDDDRSMDVALVSEALAKRHWPGRSAVGTRIRLGGLGEATRERIVVGVVSDVLMGDPLARDRSTQAVYIPLRQTGARDVQVVFRHRGDGAAAQGSLHQVLTDIDPLLPPVNVMTFDEVLSKSALLARGVATLFSYCFGFALLLAVSGTYGLMSRSIGQRSREIGVRRALGATDGSIVRLLLTQGGRQVGVGALVALPPMLAVSAGFAHFFPVGIGLTIATGVLVVATIVGVVLAATYVPTRRALATPVLSALGRD